MLNPAQMNTENVLHVQEDSYFSRSSKQSGSRSQFDKEYYPVTPPTEELEENASTGSPQIFTAADQDFEPLVVVIGAGYVGSHPSHLCLFDSLQGSRIRHLRKKHQRHLRGVQKKENSSFHNAQARAFGQRQDASSLAYLQS